MKLDNGLKNLVKEAVKKHTQLAIELSDDLAAHPELPFEEFESSKKIVNILEKAGYKMEYPFSGYETAFCATLENGEGPSVAILVEYDALPDIGHGCGHNLHGSMSVLSGLALMELKDYFKGTLYLIGTPAEETDGAKIGMADKGVFDNMDMAMMIHSFAGGESESAMRCLALKSFDFTFHGQTAHAAACPWEGKNAVSAARIFLDMVDMKRQSFTPDVRIGSVITDGGRLTNIIPELAKVSVEMRAEDLTGLNKVMESIFNCARAAAMAFDCQVEWEKTISEFADLVANEPAEKEMYKIMEELGVKMRPQSPPTASSDIGNVSYRCPALHPILSITDEPYNLHTVELARATTEPKAHEALVVGSEVLAHMTLKIMNDAEFCGSIREEFEKQIKLKSR